MRPGRLTCRWLGLPQVEVMLSFSRNQETSVQEATSRPVSTRLLQSLPPALSKSKCLVLHGS